MELVTKRCHQCRQILLKHEAGAFVDDRRIEVKCKCNAMNYIVDWKAEGTPTPTEGRSKAGCSGDTSPTNRNRRTDHAQGTA